MDFHPSLRDVQSNHEFWVRDGPKLKNLYELEHELRRMSDTQFMHHVNDSKNDFYNWIFHVVKDTKLSEQLAQVKVRNAMADIIERHIQLLEKDARPAKSVKEVNAVKNAVKAPVKRIVKKVVVKNVQLKLEKIKVHEMPKFEIPKVTMPDFVPELPLVPAVAPLPLSFEEVEERIRRKVGPMPEIAEPHYEMSVSHIHAEHKPLHHRIHHHIKTHATHYATLVAGLTVGLLIAKYFI